MGVLSNVLRGARLEVTAMLEELLRDTEKNGKDRDRLEALDRLKRAQAQLNNWRDDGFVILDLNTPNAFVHGMIPQLIFVHRGLFWRTETRPFPADMKKSSLPQGAHVYAQIDGRLLPCTLVSQCDGDDACRTVCLPNETEHRDIPVEDLRLVEKKDGVVQNDEQLAMLLAHELSHVIHDHAEDMTTILALATGLQLVLLACVDPTGLGSLIIELCMGS